MRSLDRRIVIGALTLAALVGVSVGARATSGHELTRATGTAAITLLLCALATSPLARWLAPAPGVALRASRRPIGIAAALAAIAHASLALPGYVAPVTLAPIAALPWLRHGALALGILAVLLCTSFSSLRRALRVRAWSALHRLVYAAALLASLHALAVPFGTTTIGLVALGLTVFFLAARLVGLAIPRARAQAEREDGSE